MSEVRNHRSFSGLTAVVLAGGLGTRLRTVVIDRPKVLATVAGRPFLTYLLNQLAAAGVTDVVLCTGYLADQVRETYGDTYRSMRLSYSLEKSPRGTAGALRHALPLIHSDEILVMNGDSFCDVDLQNFYAHHVESEALASICLTGAEDSSRFGRVILGSDSRIIRFEEKSDCRGPGLINAGIYCLATCLLNSIPPMQRVSLEREVFPKLIGQKFYGYCETERTFIDIGTPESYQKAEELFSQGAYA